MRADDEGRPIGGEVYTRGGGRGEDPSTKNVWKFFFKFVFIKQTIFFIGHFFHHFSWGVGNTSGFGMQLCFGVRSDRY